MSKLVGDDSKYPGRRVRRKTSQATLSPHVVSRVKVGRRCDILEDVAKRLPSFHATNQGRTLRQWSQRVRQAAYRSGLASMVNGMRTGLICTMHYESSATMVNIHDLLAKTLNIHCRGGGR